MKKEEIEKLAEGILKKYYFNKSSFVDLSVILDKEKFKLIELENEKWNEVFKNFKDSKDAEAVLYVNEKKIKHIILNRDRVKNIRNSVAHEIGHSFLNHVKDEENVFVCHHGSDTNEEENEADYFAACLLMPKDAVLELVKKSIIPNVQNFADIFRVEEEMVRRRFYELGIFNA